MDHETQLFLTLVVVLEVKHFVCDYVLQTPFQLRNKGTYGHPGGLLHAGVHIVGSLAAFAVVLPQPWVIAVLLVGEFLVHYHLDWAKEQVNRRFALVPTRTSFWIAMGADQLFHHLTYVAMAALIVSFPAR